MRQWLTNTLSCVGAPRRTKGTPVRHSYTDVARGTDWLCCVVMCNFCTECPHAVYDRFASPCARRVSISTFTCPIYSPGIIFSISSCSNSNSNVQSVCAIPEENGHFRGALLPRRSHRQSLSLRPFSHISKWVSCMLCAG